MSRAKKCSWVKFWKIVLPLDNVSLIQPHSIECCYVKVTRVVHSREVLLKTISLFKKVKKKNFIKVVWTLYTYPYAFIDYFWTDSHVKRIHLDFVLVFLSTEPSWRACPTAFSGRSSGVWRGPFGLAEINFLWSRASPVEKYVRAERGAHATRI